MIDAALAPSRRPNRFRRSIVKRIGLASTLVVGVLAVGPAQALGATLEVDDDKVECKKAPFTSIQAAVTAASPGDSIKVCPGTYTEQVKITKDGLKLFSRNPLAAVIKAPPAMVEDKAIVEIEAADDVTVRDFTITGPGGGNCDSLRYGVLVGGPSSDPAEDAEIRHNHITEIRDNPFGGCQNGNAVQVGRQSAGVVGSADVVGNTIDRYQKTGVGNDGPGSSAVIRQNTIEGVGPTATIAQNGVQVSRDAVAEVRQNEISDNLFSPQTFASAGVLLFQADPETEVVHNTILRNDEGVYLSDQHGGTVSHNEASDSTFDGIGIVDGSTDVLVEHNVAERNAFDGVYAGSDSSENTVAYNHLSDNADHDCHDDSTGPHTPGVANIWFNNKGVTENKPGLCEGEKP
jgi:parallel beta-helix repeat protein